MRTSDLFKQKRVFSFEIFPPKKDAPVQTIYDTVKELADLKPDFISVTFGAGGTSANADTLQIASTIKNEYHIESVAHLPCINFTKDEIKSILEGFHKAGIENILALRGDVNPNLPRKSDFTYANELISFIKEQGDFNIIAACYPEGHFESTSMISDIRNLKRKVDAGADHLITQLFFDNHDYFSFKERAALVNIEVPIEAGIMPVVNRKQIERMVSLCKVKLPRKFLSIMDRFEYKPEAMRDAGIAYAIDQIVDLIAEGCDGIHLYTMNNPYIAKRIYEAVHNLI